MDYVRRKFGWYFVKSIPGLRTLLVGKLEPLLKYFRPSAMGGGVGGIIGWGSFVTNRIKAKYEIDCFGEISA